MAIKRVVDTSFWTDSNVVDLFSPEDKYFMLYILTNPHTTQLGIYELNIRIASFEMGYSTETVTVLIDRFETKYNIIKYNKETREIAIKNFLVHSIIKGGKPVADCLNKEIRLVKDKSLIDWVFSSIKNKTSINITVRDVIERNDNENDNDNDNDNEVSYHDSYHDSYIGQSPDDVQTNKEKDTLSGYECVIDYLNEKVGTRYSFKSAKTKRLMKARVNEGYTVDDFKKVIDVKVADWLENDMAKFLRPETLFSNKFEGYLNQKAKVNTKTLGNIKHSYSREQLDNLFADVDNLKNI